MDHLVKVSLKNWYTFLLQKTIPVILRPADWKGTPFEQLQVLPHNAKPVTRWQNRDDALLDVARGIREAIEELLTSSLLRPLSSGKQQMSTREKSLHLWNVPYRRNPFFTGREGILTNLHDQLHKERATALTQPQAISGLGGVGKTQIATEYAYRYRDEHQAVLWVGAATRDTLIADLVALAGPLGLPERNQQDQNSVVAAVKRWLSNNARWLLILDNADDLSMISEFLISGDNGYVLLTTRAQAMGRLAQSIEIEKMEPEEGTLFLLRRASALAPDAQLDQATREDRAKAEVIVQIMDGLPLALDQAGAYIEETGCSLSSYLDLYKRQRSDLLKRRGGLVADHPEPVATTWSLSFERVEQVNPAAADLLRLCAFLSPDAIPEEIIIEGAPELGSTLQPVAVDQNQLNTAMAELLKYSLVRRNHDQTLTIHRLVQAVLRDGMNEHTQRVWAERAVRVVNMAFPKVEFATWQRCQQHLPQALICDELIEQNGLTFPEAAYLLDRVGFYLHTQGQYKQAEMLYRHALAIYEKVLGPEHLETAASLNNLGRLYRDHGNLEQAEMLYRHALAIYEKVLGPEHLETAASLNNLGRLYYLKWQNEEAELLVERALSIQKRLLGPDHPEIAVSLNNLAKLYLDQGQYEQAESHHQKALAIFQKAFGPEHPNVAVGLNNLAILYHTQGKYKDAEQYYKLTLTLRRKVLGPEHPDIAASLYNLAWFYRDRHKYKQAEPLYHCAHVAEKTLPQGRGITGVM